MSQYFHDKYKRNLDTKQPLLFKNDNKRGRRIYFPAELCNQANLPPDFTKNTYNMR